MKIDVEETKRALRTLFLPGDVFEIRALNAVVSENGRRSRPQVVGGFFDYEHIDAVPLHLGGILEADGVYVTLNPVDPDSMYCNNAGCLKASPKTSTSDSNIVRRRWFFIDLDAKRRANISSTDDEHLKTLLKAKVIRDYLTGKGWPEPVMVDSGNGTHILYHTDMETEDGGLFRRVLETMSGASDNDVELDRTVFNPARIIRLPGTMNCKGRDSAERPHRMAKITDIPENIGFVTAEMLEDICGGGAPDTSSVTVMACDDREFDSKFDIVDWMRDKCPDARETPVSGSGYMRKWVFDTCPFNSAHTNRSAVVIQHSSGAVSFTCLHNGCSDNHWRELRDLRDPGYMERIISSNDNTYSDVNLDGLLAKIDGTAKEEKADVSMYLTGEDVDSIYSEKEDRAQHPWRYVTDKDVEDAIDGTVLGDLCDIYRSACKPCLPVAAGLVKAIATAGCSISGESGESTLNNAGHGDIGNIMAKGIDRSKIVIDTGGGDFCNFFCILVGNSGSGKDIGHFLELFMDTANRDAKGESYGYDVGNGGSAEGFADSLKEIPNGLINISELSEWLDEKSWMNKAMGFLTDAWDRGRFKYALSRRASQSTRTLDYCSPSAIANVQPRIFADMATKKLLYSGNFGRWLFACMPEDTLFYGRPNNSIDRNVIRSRIENLAELFKKKECHVSVREGYSDELSDMFENRFDTSLDSVWRRLVNQYYTRLAVILSVTHDPATHGKTIKLTDDAFARARTLVMWFAKNAEKMLSQINDNDDDRFRTSREKMYMSVFKCICTLYRKTGKYVTMGALSHTCPRNGNKGRTNSVDRKEAIDEMVARGWIEVVGGGVKPVKTLEEISVK